MALNETRTLTLDELTNLFDDVNPEDIAVEEPSSYQDAPMPAPLPPGKYGLQLTAIDVDRDQAGHVRNKMKLVANFRVVDAPNGPEWATGKDLRYINVSAIAYDRKVGGITKKASELGDLIRGYDATFSWQSSPEVALRFLLERIADNAIVYVQTDWKAWDTKHFQASNGESLQNGSEEKKKLYNEVSFKGARRFEKDGSLLNPASGNLLKAKPYLSRVYAASNA